MTSAEQFFTYGVLKTRPDNDITDGLGLPDPTLLAALAVTWIILYFSLRGGVGGQGKVVLYNWGNFLHNWQDIEDNVDPPRLLTSLPFFPTWSYSPFSSGD